VIQYRACSWECWSDATAPAVYAIDDDDDDDVLLNHISFSDFYSFRSVVSPLTYVITLIEFQAHNA